MATPGSKVIRVFLSSTFVDFQEERSLLVKQVFPSLRRRARSRGVEIVDVDLRWGVTEEQTKHGETLPLCLAEIDRCRPYFISLLGERYGWVPPADYYKPELLERQPWLREQMGGASVTELEILHGVLRHPEMAGHACFYLRDPAYAQAQSQPGWVAENPQERQRLVALKEEVRRSGFPVMEGLADPQAIAERIEADLWELIERTFPEQEPPDALEREGRRHADYRRARTGLYLGGETAIAQLEGWLAAGEQRILITGESGAGKSALIANWLEAHQRSHPQDLVHANHLDCTNDASAVRPLLGRLINTASQLLLAGQQISEPIKVPQDWWELVFKVGKVFALLNCWCQRQGRRWILVLDGLDRLAEDDQQALPWIPTTLPPGIHIVASALDCPARLILHEREYLTQTIGPLGESEQQQLIERYLSRYTKQLESGLQQKILAHPLAGSPLFLKVLLEELRQCAGFDTLAHQMQFYLSADSIDGLYGKVLERLEKDGHGEATRKALTALWASRAGLSETELLAIKDLAPVEWAPVDLALEEAFGRNGDLMVFGHDYLRRAVKDCYLTTDEVQHEAHSGLADWYKAKGKLDEEFAREHPWQLVQAGRLAELKSHLVQPAYLALLSFYNGELEAADYWRSVELLIKSDQDDFESNIREGIGWELERVAARQEENRKSNSSEDLNKLIWFVDTIAEFLLSAGFHSSLQLDLRKLSVELTEANEGASQDELLDRQHEMAGTMSLLGMHQEAEDVYLKCLSDRRNLLGAQHSKTLATLNNLAQVYRKRGMDNKAESLFVECNKIMLKAGMAEHPDRLSVLNNLASIFTDTGRLSEAEALLRNCALEDELLKGKEDESTIISKVNLSSVFFTRVITRKPRSCFCIATRTIADCAGTNIPIPLRSKRIWPNYIKPWETTIKQNRATLAA